MKSKLVKSLLVLFFILFSYRIFSQCTVNYLDPSYFEFSHDFHYEFVYVYTYPEECTPTIESYSDWLTLGQWSGSLFVISCYENTGMARSGMIRIGDAYIEVYQEGAPLQPGAIGGGTSPICSNTSPGTFTNVQSAYGGGCDTYTYQWQISTDGTTAVQDNLKV